MLDRIVGKQRDAVVGADALRLADRSRCGRVSSRNWPIGERPAVVGGNDERLVRIARGGAVDPVAQQLRTGLVPGFRV